MNAQTIIDRLRDRYPLGDGWITMAEVTPPKCQRRFDLIAIMGWASRGHEAMGFEVKVERSDWLRELNDPAKAEPLARLCSRYWIVAPPGVVKEAELPPAWGLLVAHPAVLRAERQAERLVGTEWNQAMWRCMLLRCASRQHELLAHEVRKARLDAVAQRENGEAETTKGWVEKCRELQGFIDQAEKATGVRLCSWTDYPALGQAMAIVREAGTGRTAERLDRDAASLRAAAVTLENTAAQLRVQAEKVPA